MKAATKPTHSKIGASSYYRWKACPASVRLSHGVEQKHSDYAEAGTVAHDIAAKLLEDAFFNTGKPLIPAGYSAEELSHVKYYVSEVIKEAKCHGCQVSKGHVLIEHRFDLSSVHPGLFGTADCVLYLEKEKKLLVFDYKHGAGIPVEVENNLQLLYYGTGALLSTGFVCSTVELIIVQPRCHHSRGPIRRCEVDAVELLDFMADLKADAIATEDPKAAINPGDHCRFCPAAADACPVLRERALAVAKAEFQVIRSYDSIRLSQALDAIPAIEAWIKQVRETAYQEAMHGNPPAEYKLVEKRASRKWRFSEEATAKALSDIAPDVEFFESKLMSPAQVEKLISKESREYLDEFVVKESSGFALVHASDKRAAAKVGAQHEFIKIEGGHVYE